MTRTVKCVKLGKEAEGLKMPPYPGELGKRIFDNVSQEAWKQWLGHQTMLINEYRLALRNQGAPVSRTGNGEVLLRRRRRQTRGLRRPGEVIAAVVQAAPMST